MGAWLSSVESVVAPVVEADASAAVKALVPLIAAEVRKIVRADLSAYMATLPSGSATALVLDGFLEATKDKEKQVRSGVGVPISA